MEITLPPPFEKELTPEDLAVNLAVGLYTGGTDLPHAAEIAGLNIAEFIKELGRRDIPLRYTLEDLAVDLATVRSLPPP